jgi:oxygen-independent coproporphyrinogen-3 oxidase
MLRALKDEGSALRFQNTDDLDAYMDSGSIENGVVSPLAVLQRDESAPEPELVGRDEAFEESLFLGLRLNEGIDLADLRRTYGHGLVDNAMPSVLEVREAGLLDVDGDRVRLTARGRMASNEVFSRLLVPAVA